MVAKNEDVLPQRLTIRSLAVAESYEHKYLSHKGLNRRHRGELGGEEKPEIIRQMKIPFRVDQKEKGLVIQQKY